MGGTCARVMSECGAYTTYTSEWRNNIVTVTKHTDTHAYTTKRERPRHGMEFRRACAEALDAGAPAEEVLARMRKRYTTPRSLHVQTCLVRQLCAPAPAYAAARDALLAEVQQQQQEEEDHQDLLPRLVRSLAAGRACDPEVRALLAALPHRLPPNVYALRATRAEVREVKRLSARGAVEKNRTRRRVDGRALLAAARAGIAESKQDPIDLALALMLLTGRRTCEILNGASTFAIEGEHALRFGGQAKRRGGGGADYVIPTLAPAARVAEAWHALRALQGQAVLSNEATSRRYQGTLSRRVAAAWPQVGCAHGMRGVYACMALRLFDWGDAADAYVAMGILGHRGLHESLVYTPFHLGDAFADEPRLGSFTPPPLPYGDGEEETEGVAVVPPSGSSSGSSPTPPTFPVP